MNDLVAELIESFVDAALVDYMRREIQEDLLRLMLNAPAKTPRTLDPDWPFPDWFEDQMRHATECAIRQQVEAGILEEVPVPGLIAYSGTVKF